MPIHETHVDVEKVILVGVTITRQQRIHEEDSLEELAQLVDTAGGVVIHQVVQQRETIHSGTYIGTGKAEYIAGLVKELNADTVIFDNDLSPAQNRNLEKIFECKVIDRTAVILDIFALHARTIEAKLQIELAQLEYILPRLTRMWVHLVGSQGGIGFRGPGETQLEVDRRIIKKKISDIKRKLAKIHAQRETQRKSRKNMFRVAIIGYTNAGKSTLLNALSDADVYVEDKLFATLDTTTRIVDLAENQKILLTDTVGFIKHLPHHLVASFRATLEEADEADVLLHIIDASHPNFRDHILAVNEVIADLILKEKPLLEVFNKIDLVENNGANLKVEFPDCLVISAQNGNGLIALKERLLRLVENRLEEVVFKIPQSLGMLVDQIHQKGHVLKTEYDGNDILLTAVIERSIARQIIRKLEQSAKI